MTEIGWVAVMAVDYFENSFAPRVNFFIKEAIFNELFLFFHKIVMVNEEFLIVLLTLGPEKYKM